MVKLTIFLTGAAILSAIVAAAPAPVPATCTEANALVRKEWNELTEPERQKYLKAILKLKKRPRVVPMDPNNPNTLSYDDFAQIHDDFNGEIHGNVYFMSWHRMFLLRFEQAIKSIDPTVTAIPFWDWATESQAPEKSSIFKSKYFGGSGNVNKGYCVTDGVFANWIMSVPEEHCLRREFNSRDPVTNRPALGSFIGADVLASFMDSNNFEEAASNFEGTPHSLVHRNIGLEIGDMTRSFSPNDPLFWLHHAMVDRVYWIWQKSCPSRANDFPTADPLDPTGNSTVLAKDRILAPFNLTTAQLWDIRSGANGLCHKYSPRKWDANFKCASPRTASGRAAVQTITIPGTNVKMVAATTTNGSNITSVKVDLDSFENVPTCWASRAEDNENVDRAFAGPIATYIEPKGGNVPVLASNDRTDLYNLRHPDPLPVSYIRKMGLNLAKVRELEAKANYIIDAINAMPNYTPLDALIFQKEESA